MSGDAMMGMVATIAMFSIPIVAILTSHQRKMAQIIHGNHRENVANEALQQEIQQLRQVVYQQSIEMDNLRSEVRRSLAQSSTEPLATRLQQDQHTT